MDAPAMEVNMPFRSIPVSVAVDPDHRVMRRMAPSEIAPTLSQVLGDKRMVVVKPGSASGEAAAAYEDLAAQLGRPEGVQVVVDSELTDSLAASHSLLILGGRGENSALEAFAGKWSQAVFPKAGSFVIGEKRYTSSDDCALYVGRHPNAGGKAVAVVAGLSGYATRASARKLVHYGKYSHVVFKNGTAVDKGILKVRDYPRMDVKFQAVG
jgi:hypothetical protein